MRRPAVSHRTLARQGETRALDRLRSASNLGARTGNEIVNAIHLVVLHSMVVPGEIRVNSIRSKDRVKIVREPRERSLFARARDPHWMMASHNDVAARNDRVFAFRIFLQHENDRSAKTGSGQT